MALTQLQSDILRHLAKNRSKSSYLAGGLMLNKNWARSSDDIDIFHDSDEQVTGAATADLASLEAAGYRVQKDVFVYGCVDATISDGHTSTIIQWAAETTRRFFPLVHDDEWGARLDQADLAVNKVLAASARTKARDIADLVSIAHHYCPLGPLVLAAAGKPPNFSPKRTIDEIRRHALSIPADDYASIKGLPADWSAGFIRDNVLDALTDAESYIAQVSPELVGLLAVDKAGIPVKVLGKPDKNVILRKATDEPDVMPVPTNFNSVDWDRSRE